MVPKMLTLNFHSCFLWSITVTNFSQRLKVRIVSKSELFWLFENVHNFNLRHLGGQSIARHPVGLSFADLSTSQL